MSAETLAEKIYGAEHDSQIAKQFNGMQAHY